MKYLILVLALAASVAHAADLWVPIATTPEISYAFKRGSCHIGESSIVCTERQLNAKTNSSHFTFTGTAKSACADGYGVLMTFNLSGEVVARNEVVAKGGSVGSDEFDALCDILAANSGPVT